MKRDKKEIDFLFPLMYWFSLIGFVTFIMFFTLHENKYYLKVHAFIHSDFLVHIPLIQSFYYGGNFHPIEYPLFVGEKINYHYGFHILAALLEKLGLSFSFAVNFLSILGFSLLIYFMYLFAKYIAKDKIAPYIAAILPFLNFSLTWYMYLLKHGSHWLIDIPYLKQYTCFGPWDGCIISVFWNLNIYLNQRHLAMGFGLTFFLIYLISFVFYRKRKFLHKALIILLCILILIALVYIHKGMLIVSLMFWGLYVGIRFIDILIMWKKGDERENLRDLILLGVGLILSFILVLLFLEFAYSQFTRPEGLKVIRIYPGFLYRTATSLHHLKVGEFVKWLIYMGANLGILPILALLGFLFSLRKMKNRRELIFNISFFILSWAVFVLANVIVFSVEVGINHKFINFSILIWEIYTAYAFVKLYKAHILGKLFVILVVILLMFNALIDYIPIFNGYHIWWEKPNHNPVGKWILTYTDPRDKFLNITYLTTPLAMTGRRIFFGWDYFAMSAGYETYKRRREYYSFLGVYKRDPLLARERLCEIMKKYHLKYLYLNGHDKFIDLDIDATELANTMLKGIKPLYHSGKTYIYSCEEICKNTK